MTTVETLRAQAAIAFDEFKGALEGLTEAQAWAVLPAGTEEYLHTDGSIQGLVLHVASGKKIYGSVAFRYTEFRFRDLAEEIEAFEPSWEAALRYLDVSHAYWMSTWADLTDADLDREVPRFDGKLWPAWKVLHTVIHHDGWHGGQIPLLRYAVGGSTLPPPSYAEDIRKYCVDLTAW